MTAIFFYATNKFSFRKVKRQVKINIYAIMELKACGSLHWFDRIDTYRSVFIKLIINKDQMVYFYLSLIKHTIH